MLRICFSFRRISVLIAPVLVIALAAVMFASAPAETQTSPADATTTTIATPTVAPTITDYDTDNDGLIEIRTLAQLNAVRYDLNGNGAQDSVSAADWSIYAFAFSNAASGMGCSQASDTTTPQQATCIGYELMANLDFDTDGDGDVDASDTNSYPNWTPIGTDASPFNATFEGNIIYGSMSKISNLTMSGASAEAGLFGATGSNARIEDVGLVDAKVDIDTSSGNAKIGALVGSNAGKVIACYSTGAITASVSTGGYAGGLVGYNMGTIAAGFSRATVYMKMDTGATGGSANIYAGGLAGHNSGTITAAYAAGAVKVKGGSGSGAGGLVGFNTAPQGTTRTITASYSIAPVTAVGMTVATNDKPNVGGLIGCCNDSTATITASYWDFMSSGIYDDSGLAMPEGKSTYDLTSPTSATSIYADWDNLTIDGASDVDPWIFEDRHPGRFHPLLRYGGHAIDISGNQLFANGGIDSRYSGNTIHPREDRNGGNTIHPREGMTLYSDIGAYERGFRGQRNGGWDWETSDDGITWAPAQYPRAARGTFSYVPRAEHIGKYIRAKVALKTGGHAYTRVIGKIKAASTTAPVALSFASGHNPPLVGTAITVASLPPRAVGLWYRCDTVDDTPPGPGCELVGSLAAYTPGTADLNHYIRAYIYYKDRGVWKRASPGGTQQPVSEAVPEVQRVNPWRER